MLKTKNWQLPLSTASSDEVVAVSTDNNELASVVVSTVVTIDKGSVSSCSFAVDSNSLVIESVNEAAIKKY